MPRIKRWFPVSQDINDDDEMWEFTSTFGDRAFRTWMEILKILDKNENRFRLSEEGYASLSRRLRQTSANLRRQVGWLLARGWLASLEPPAEGLPVVLYAPNYWKFHGIREKNGEEKKSHNSPLRTEPSEPNLKDTDKPNGLSSPTLGETPKSGSWSESLRFVKLFLENGAPPLTHPELLLDNDWWVDLFDSIHGFDHAFLQEEFAKMSLWLNDNPRRRPLVKAASYRKFVRNWFGRAHERRRRFAPQSKR